MKKISFDYKGKKFNVDAKECKGPKKIFGLMFNSKENAKALLFSFDRPTNIKIHSLFVFFPFAAVWLDGKNRVIDAKIVKPFTLAANPKRQFFKLVEIPLNKKYSKIIKFLITDERLERFKYRN